MRTVNWCVITILFDANVIFIKPKFLTFGNIIIGITGFIGMGINYPVYKKILEKGKKKYAFEIVELAKEISEN